jgi:hypothetical protein
MLSKESVEAGSAPFVEMQNMIRDAVDRHLFRVDVPIELISKILGSCAVLLGWDRTEVTGRHFNR